MGVWFRRADLRYAGFVNPDLRGAVFSAADIKGAVFHEETKLRYADFENANLEATLFLGVDLSETRGLTQQQIDQAYFYEGTKVPVDLQIPRLRDSDQDNQAAED